MSLALGLRSSVRAPYTPSGAGPGCPEVAMPTGGSRLVPGSNGSDVQSLQLGFLGYATQLAGGSIPNPTHIYIYIYTYL